MSKIRKPLSDSRSNNRSPKVLVAAIITGGMIVLAGTRVGWDLLSGHSRKIDCGDGERGTIDGRQFATEYSQYSLQLEADLNGKERISLKLDPIQQASLSEAVQSANEFRNYVVAGFNSCAISKFQYAQYGARF